MTCRAGTRVASSAGQRVHDIIPVLRGARGRLGGALVIVIQRITPYKSSEEF